MSVVIAESHAAYEAWLSTAAGHQTAVEMAAAVIHDEEALAEWECAFTSYPKAVEALLTQYVDQRNESDG